MGFNYLQTDDRDDYFDSIHKSKSKNRPIGYTLISPEGDEIFKEEPMFKLRTYCKKNYLPIGADDNKNWWIQGANFVNERQPYSVEDMFWFYMWMSTKGTMLIRKGLKITTTELLKLWEESRK